MTTAPKPLDLAPIADAVRACRSLAPRAPRDQLRGFVIQANKQRDALIAEVERLLAVVEGSTVAPTMPEVWAHEARSGGYWLYQPPPRSREDLSGRLVEDQSPPQVWYFLITEEGEFHARIWSENNGEPQAFATLPTGRWWALDANGAPTQWPTVTAKEAV